jgi:hypothetical protein
MGEYTMQRQDIAIKIALANPDAFRKAISKKPVQYKNIEEKTQVAALKGLIQLEPSIRHILEYYLKRDQIAHAIYV